MSDSGLLSMAREMLSVPQGITRTEDGKRLKAREEVVEVPLSQIWRDRTWNARSGNWEDDTEEIYESMQPEGVEGPIVQDSAVVLRPIETLRAMYDNQVEIEIPPECVYALVSGFGRCEVRMRIAKEREEENPTILAVVRNMTEAEALAANIRENTGRNELKPADVAWQLWNLHEFYGSVCEWKTAEQLAPMIARKADTTRKLLSIMKRGDKKVVDAWRNCRIVISVDDMTKVVALPRIKQMEAYRALLVAPGGTRQNGRRITSDKTVRMAESTGRLLGALEREGLIELRIDFTRDIDKLVPIGGRDSFERRKVVADAARQGYEEGRRALEPKPSKGSTDATTV
jgi:hypothetical protein